MTNSRNRQYTLIFDLDNSSSTWKSSQDLQIDPGLVIYSKFDGGYSIFSRDLSLKYFQSEHNSVNLNSEDIINGLSYSEQGRKNRYICNGIINDLLDWQSSKNRKIEVFTEILRVMSPSINDGDLGILTLGRPTKILGDSRSIPTIKHIHGSTPIIHASAGVRKIINFAYSIVWSWFEIAENFAKPKGSPLRLTLIIDEIESHLHPKWQLSILSNLLKVMKILNPNMLYQIFVATHSPLVTASLEPFFDTETDGLFRLDLVKDDFFGSAVIFEEVIFDNIGSIDNWLSKVFESPSYNLSTEIVLKKAEEVLDKEKPSQEEIKRLSQDLQKSLPPHDPFWVRWLYFVKFHGAEI